MLIGKWTPLEELFREIRRLKNFKELAKLTVFAFLYQASSLSFALFAALVLEASGIADFAVLAVKVPLSWWIGVILVAFGIVLSASSTSVLGEYESKSGESPQRTLQLLPADIYKKVLQVPPRNRLEKALVELTMVLSVGNLHSFYRCK